MNQPTSGYRAAIDPVLLAAACPAVATDHVLDAGCGVGTAALCLMARTGCRAAGIEVQPHLADLATRNGIENGFADRFRVVTGSIMDQPLSSSRGLENKFDHVICNPPYLPEGYGSGKPSLANNESDAKLADWIDFAIRQVKDGGSVIFIHRADRLDELLIGYSARLSAITILPLLPHAGESAHRVLIGGIKGRKTPLRLLAGMVLHNAGGTYTGEADAVLRDMAAVGLWS